ncbi:hypothetical protein HGP14_26800 [Rhizobium sp. P32RR-XVIII]|uniref:hypothetical protein n=1 Tax=Rhizobium sp. P32RR-XVIII TaxID=2726738 RepID=UPI001457688F|nr:hypothetical protein [Rhizobium sp. P32RR-XVIII]NLS06915.1 hypothetical protein [Rhizobium sp. P32RR-XVIII]
MSCQADRAELAFDDDPRPEPRLEAKDEDGKTKGNDRQQARIAIGNRPDEILTLRHPGEDEPIIVTTARMNGKPLVLQSVSEMPCHRDGWGQI